MRTVTFVFIFFMQMRLDQDKYLSNSRKRFITIAGMLWGIVMSLSLNTGSLTNAVDFTIPTTLSLNEATLNMPGSITVASSGTLQTSSGTINISGDGNWSNSGIFSPGNGTVQFNGTNHGINGDSTFYSFIFITADGQLAFEAGKTQIITGITRINGASGNYLRLRSSSDGTQWIFDPQGTRDINYVDVKDSNNLSSTIISPSNWTDIGNNTNWSSEQAPPPEPQPTPETLTVISTSPSNGATGVAVTTTVSATFSMFVKGSTVSTDTFTLSDGSSLVSGTVSTNGATVTFIPSSSLANSTTYTATLTTGITAANFGGTQMTSNYTWSFTTIAATSTPTSTPTPQQTPTVTPTTTTTTTSTTTTTQSSGGGGGGGGGNTTTTTTSTTTSTTTTSTTTTSTTTTTLPEPLPTLTPSPTPITTPSPTPVTTPTQPAALRLSKEAAYLSGDTVVVTVVDADRDSDAALADTLTTALKVTALNYYAGGDLTLDLKENAVNSGTFLATIKTGTITSGGASVSSRANLSSPYFHIKTETATSGGASSSVRSNIGTVKATQGGTATVIYTDTTRSEEHTSE